MKVKTVLTHHAVPWSTCKPVVVKVTLPREPWSSAGAAEHTALKEKGDDKDE